MSQNRKVWMLKLNQANCLDVVTFTTLHETREVAIDHLKEYVRSRNGEIDENHSDDLCEYFDNSDDSYSLEEEEVHAKKDS